VALHFTYGSQNVRWQKKSGPSSSLGRRPAVSQRIRVGNSRINGYELSGNINTLAATFRRQD